MQQMYSPSNYQNHVPALTKILINTGADTYNEVCLFGFPPSSKYFDTPYFKMYRNIFNLDFVIKVHNNQFVRTPFHDVL